MEFAGSRRALIGKDVAQPKVAKQNPIMQIGLPNSVVSVCFFIILSVSHISVSDHSGNFFREIHVPRKTMTQRLVIFTRMPLSKQKFAILRA